MKIKLIVFAGLALTVFAACSNTANKTTQKDVTKTTTAAIATTLPAFKVMGMNGNIINLADLRGKKVFVNLWAS